MLRPVSDLFLVKGFGQRSSSPLSPFCTVVFVLLFGFFHNVLTRSTSYTT